MHRAAGASSKKVKRWLSEQDTYTLHKPTTRRFKHRRVIVCGINKQWHADLIDIARLKQYNDGNTFLLTIIYDIRVLQESVVRSDEEQVGIVTHGNISSVAKRQVADGSGKGVFDSEIPRVSKITRYPKRYDVHRSDPGLYRRTIQSYSEDAHAEVFHDKLDLQIHRDVAASPEFVQQQLSQKYPHGTGGSELNK